MPVLLEHIHQPTTADWQDLEKIHLDTADNGFLFNKEQLQQWLSEGGWIMAGRFNDRIIGALLAKEIADEVHLSQVGVRTITQRRGVIHQLLHFICAWSKAEQQTLRINQCPLQLQTALIKRGFVQKNDYWLFVGNST